ncbi:MAG: glycosyltransferase family 1 protein [Micromonosporaceae bacterium]|nr:glycosyltransferase family 1 protein [Micromonosporaceae bacterium]
MSGIRVAVVVDFPGAGRLNPMLAITAALADRTDVAEVGSFGPPGLSDSFTRAGARHETVEAPPGKAVANPGVPHFAHRAFLLPRADVQDYVERIREFAPDVVLADGFSLRGLVAARHLKVPHVCMLVGLGYYAIGDDLLNEHGLPHPALSEANDYYRDTFGVDVLGEGMLPVLFPSAELAIATGLDSLPVPKDTITTPGLAELLDQYARVCVFVGPCLSEVRFTPPEYRSPGGTGAGETAGPHDRRAPFPFHILDDAVADGRRIVLFAPGTVLTNFRLHAPFGGAPTGREFLAARLNELVQAFGGDRQVLVVASIGKLAAGDEPDWPDNFVVRDFVPQLVLLNRYADAFISHMGWNSMVESLLAGVPMVALPGLGDQFLDARAAIAENVAVVRWPLENVHAGCDSQRLKAAVLDVLDDPSHRAACKAFGSRLVDAGGAERAAQLVVERARTT